MLSREDKYRSTIIDRIIKSLGNGLTSGVYLRTTIDDSGTNEVVISTDPSNATITIANVDGSASRTFDYSSGITWSEFNFLFTSTSSTDNVEVNGTSITISNVKVRDEPSNVTPIDWGSFTNITLSNCTFDVKRIDGAFSKSGPISISIDNTNDFTNVYSFDHLFDGCNTLTSIVFNPIHNGMFTANWMLANLSRELTPHKFVYTDYEGSNRTVVEWTRDPFNISLLDFTNCHSALNLLDGTDYVSSITLSSSDFDKQSVGTLLTLGNYNWSVSPIYSKSNSTITFEIHGYTSFRKLVAKLVQEQTGTIPQPQTSPPSTPFEVDLVIENVTIFYYDYEKSYKFDGDSSATEVGYVNFYSDESLTKVWRTNYKTGFGDTFKSIDVTFKNCNIYSAGLNQTDTLFYPFTSLSFENCYFGPYSLIGNFQYWILCESVNFTNCDTSEVVYLRSTFGRYYSLEVLDLSGLNFDNVITAKYICVNDGESFTYSTPSGSKTIAQSLTKVIFPSRMPKLRSLQMAFRYCASLETVILPSDLSSLSGHSDTFLDKTTIVKDEETIEVYSTQKIVITPNIDNYGINSEMVNINLDEDDLYTGLSSTFLGCISLKYIKFPPMNALRQMYNTFNGCVSLEKVEFEDMNSLEVIQDIFDGCVALKSVKFKSCINLEYIYDMFTSVSTLEELEMLNCPNVNRFVNLVPSSVKILKLEGFNSIIRNYTPGNPTPSLIPLEDQITYHDIGSSVYTNYVIFHYAANGYDKLEEIEFIGFNNIATLYLLFTSSLFPRLRKLRLIGFTNCTSCYGLVQFHNTIEDVYMEGFYNINSLFAAFANTSNLKNVSLILSDNITINTPYILDTQWMCERAVGLEKFVWHGNRFANIYNDYNQSIKIAYSFLFYCNALRYLDLSGMRIFEFDSEYMTKGILAQIIDDSTIPYGWTLQPSHLTTLVVPNLYNTATNSSITIRDYIPFGYERYKKAIVYSIDSTTTMTCKLSVMGRFFVRQSNDDIPPLDWTVMNITKDNIDYGYFEMNNTSNNSITTTTTISVTVPDTSQYSVGDEYKGIGSEKVERTGQTTITNSITYPCSIYQTRPNVVWIVGTSDDGKSNIEEYGFTAKNGLTTFPNLSIPGSSTIYYAEYISSNNSPI